MLVRHLVRTRKKSCGRLAILTCKFNNSRVVGPSEYVPRSKPKYGLVADQIQRDIQTEKYPVGSNLPTESELMRAFGVSRDTVRKALQALRNQGLVSSRQGQGSRVESKGQAATLVERIQSVDELIKFGQGARRKLLRTKTIETDHGLAEAFGVDTGRRLLEAHMLRFGNDGDRQPIAYLVVWIDALYEAITEDLEREALSIAELIERRFGVGVGAVRQKIWATRLDTETARLLQREVGDAALAIERLYYDRPGGDVHLRARSLYAADAIEIESFFQTVHS